MERSLNRAARLTVIRRRVAGGVAAVVVAGGLGVVGAGPASAHTVSATVSPPQIVTGASTVWTVTSTFEGGPDHNLRLVPHLTAGDIDLAATAVSQGAGCTLVAGNVSCALGDLLAPGDTATAYIVVRAPGVPAGTTITGTATVFSNEPPPASPPPVTISVVSPSSLPPGDASGFVPPGKALSTGANASPTLDTVAYFKLPKAGTGTAMSITSTPCAGAGDCYGKVVTLTPFSGYTDPKKPAKVRIRWDATVAGPGLASNLYVTKGGQAETVVPNCVKVNGAITQSPCLSKKRVLKSGDLQFLMLVNSGDPSVRRR